SPVRAQPAEQLRVSATLDAAGQDRPMAPGLRRSAAPEADRSAAPGLMRQVQPAPVFAPPAAVRVRPVSWPDPVAAPPPTPPPTPQPRRRRWREERHSGAIGTDWRPVRRPAPPHRFAQARPSDSDTVRNQRGAGAQRRAPVEANLRT